MQANFHIRFQCQMSLKEGMQNSNKHELDIKWSQNFYNANIPISIVCHSAFIEDLKAIIEADILYKLPPYHKIHKSLLDDARYNIQKFVELKTRSLGEVTSKNRKNKVR